MTKRVLSPELALFAEPLKFDSIVKREVAMIKPTVAQENSGQISFDYSSGSNSFLLSSMSLKATFKIVKADGKETVGTDNVATINAPLFSAFSDITLKCQDTVLSTTNNLNPYLATFLMDYSYGQEAKNVNLKRLAV